MTARIGKGKASGSDRQGRRSKARMSAFFFGGAVLAVVVSEFSLRLGLGLGNPILIAEDPACAYILKPDQDVVRFFVHTQINHFGMRSDEVPTERTAGALRLMFVGDSITYGTTRVDQREIFTEELHHDLPAIVHRPVEVLNASAGGWAPDNELSYLQSRGVFQSNFVFVVLNDGDLTQRRSTIVDVTDELPLRRPATAIGELYERYIRPRMAQFIGKADAGDSIVGNPAEVIHENLEDLDRMNELAKSQGSRLLIIYIPFRSNAPERSATSAAILSAWSRAHLVPMCDLTAAEARYATNEITLDDGIHLNAKGHHVIAQAIERSWAGLAGGQ